MEHVNDGCDDWFAIVKEEHVPKVLRMYAQKPRTANAVFEVPEDYPIADAISATVNHRSGFVQAMVVVK